MVYKYLCTNLLGCDYDKAFEVSSEDSVGYDVLCPKCGAVAKKIGKVPYGVNARFASMNPDQKKKEINKRAQKHFKKFGNDEKVMRKRNAIQGLHDKYTGGETLKKK